MRAKAVVVGGGVIGTSIAMHAARGFDPLTEPVVLLERKQLGAGSSGRSGAILRQQYSDPELAAMARDSLKEYAGFETRTGRSIGFRRTGVLTLAGPAHPEGAKKIRRNVEMQQALGIETELVEAPRIRELVPGIAVDDGCIASFEPTAGFVEPGRTVEAFGAMARFYGATTRVGVELEGIRIENGRVVGVETSDGPIETEQVVIAAGPWTRRILQAVEVDLPLRIARTESHYLTMPDPPPGTSTGDQAVELEGEGLQAELEARFNSKDALANPVAHPVLLDFEHGFYTRCEPETDRSRIGKMDYSLCQELETPEPFEEEVSKEFCGWARQAICERMPAYGKERDAGTQAAMYTMTPDAQAVIGPLSIEGLMVVSGFSGHGFKLAPSVGEGVGQMLRGHPVSAFDPEFFSPQRFAGAKNLEWSGCFGL